MKKLDLVLTLMCVCFLSWSCKNARAEYIPCPSFAQTLESKLPETLPFTFNGHTYYNVYYYDYPGAGGVQFFYFNPLSSFNYYQGWQGVGEIAQFTNAELFEAYRSQPNSGGWTSCYQYASQTTNVNGAVEGVLKSVSTSVPQQLTVTLNPPDGGTVTSFPEGLVCNNGVCQGNFPKDTPVSIIAAPSIDWNFAYSDDGNVNSVQNAMRVTMNEAKNMIVTFIPADKSKKTQRGYIVTIDGMDFGASFFPNWPDTPTAYLYDAITLKWWDEINLTSDVVIPFIWSRDTSKTNDEVQQLYEMIKKLNSTNQPVTILAHSWGTVLAYITFAKHDDIHVDKLITLGSPLNSDDPAVIKYTWEKIVNAGINSLSRPANVNTWNNFWATSDPFSGNIPILSKENNYVNKSLYFTPLISHSSYFDDAKKWDKILQDVISK